MTQEGRPRLGRHAKIGGEGDPEVFVADEQQEIDLDLARWQTLALRVLADEGVRGAAELSIMFVTEPEMAELNESYMGKTGSTDVLAFPLDAPDVTQIVMPAGSSRGPDRAPADPGDVPLLLGDVVVCPAAAAHQAPTHAGTFDDEIALLIVHGILHVLGLDHAEAAEATEMRRREQAHLEAHHWHGPMPAGFRLEHQ